MKKLFVLFVLVTVCVSFSACDLLAGGALGGVGTSSVNVFELYSSIELDMNYEEIVELIGAESDRVNENDNYINYNWEWYNNDIYEYIYVEFQDNEIYYKSYYRDGNIYGDIKAFDYDMWKSVENSDLQVFLEKYGQYVTMSSHAVFNHSTDVSEYVTYESINKNEHYIFDFVDNSLDYKSYYIQDAFNSPDSKNNIISDESLLFIEAAIDDGLPMKYEDTCLMIGSTGVLHNIRHSFSDYDDYHYEEYLWWTSTGDVVSIEFLNGDLYYCYR